MRKRVKGLDLIDRVPEELWMEIQNIIEEAVIKTILKKKKYKKEKRLSEEALQIAEKKRSKMQRRKGKMYPSECRVPRIARRDKKDFLSEQQRNRGKQQNGKD